MNTQIPRRLQTFVTTICIVMLSMSFLYSFAQSVVLPTSQIDSLTNWTMRSKISFYDGSIAFDTDEDRGMAKPQYPVLFHGLQLLANAANTQWSDTAANTIWFVFTWSMIALIAIFLYKLLHETYIALLSTTLIVTIPLPLFHLGGGYADLPLALFTILAALSVMLWKQSRNVRWLRLSMIFVLCACLTKTEGLMLAAVPWGCIMLYEFIKNTLSRKMIITHTSVMIVLALLYPLFLTFKGLHLTPHGSDTRLEWHPEAILPMIYAMFTSGSFGIGWFGVLVMTPIMVMRKNMFALWGLVTLVIVIATYALTPNVVFLLNGQSFHRQLFVPLMMCMLASMFSFTHEKK